MAMVAKNNKDTALDAFKKGDLVTVDFPHRARGRTCKIIHEYYEGVIDSGCVNGLYRVRFRCYKIPGRTSTSGWIWQRNIAIRIPPREPLGGWSTEDVF